MRIALSVCRHRCTQLHATLSSASHPSKKTTCRLGVPGGTAGRDVYTGASSVPLPVYVLADALRCCCCWCRPVSISRYMSICGFRASFSFIFCTTWDTIRILSLMSYTHQHPACEHTRIHTHTRTRTRPQRWRVRNRRAASRLPRAHVTNTRACRTPSQARARSTHPVFDHVFKLPLLRLKLGVVRGRKRLAVPAALWRRVWGCSRRGGG